MSGDGLSIKDRIARLNKGTEATPTKSTPPPVTPPLVIKNNTPSPSAPISTPVQVVNTESPLAIPLPDNDSSNPQRQGQGQGIKDRIAALQVTPNSKPQISNRHSVNLPVPLPDSESINKTPNKRPSVGGKISSLSNSINLGGANPFNPFGPRPSLPAKQNDETEAVKSLKNDSINPSILTHASLTRPTINKSRNRAGTKIKSFEFDEE